MKRSKKSTSDEPANTMGWLTTFNDMITLLMVFFVLLYTMGSIDTKSMMEFKNALQGGLGVMNQGKYVTIGVIEPIMPTSLKETENRGRGRQKDSGSQGSREKIDRNGRKCRSRKAGESEGGRRKGWNNAKSSKRR